MKIQWTAATRFFNARYAARGIELFNRGYVLSFEWQQRDDNAARIVGTVRGSHDEVYAQTINIKARDYLPDVKGVCTCPVGHNCKHVAAVLRAAIMGEKSTAASNSPRLPVHLPTQLPTPPRASNSTGNWRSGRCSNAGRIPSPGC